MGIDRGIVDADFVVDVRAGGASGDADVADDLAFIDVLASRHDEAGHVSRERLEAVSVIDHDSVAVSIFRLRGMNDAITSRMNRRSGGSGNIDSGMEFAFIAIEWISAFTERSSNASQHWPQCWSGGQAIKIVCGCAKVRAQFQA